MEYLCFMKCELHLGKFLTLARSDLFIQQNVSMFVRSVQNPKYY